MSLSAVQSVIDRLQAVYIARTRTGGTFAATTIAAAGVAAGVQAVPIVGASTGLAAGQIVRLGSGEQQEIAYVASVAANQINTVDPLIYAHVSGESVVELSLYDLGDVMDDGAQVSISGQQTTLEVSTRRLALAKLDGFLDMGASFRLPGTSLYNIAFALGIPLGNIYTSGGLTSLATDLTDCGTERNTSLVLIGVRHDATLVRVELWGCDYDYSAFSIPIGMGKAGTVPVKVMAAAGGVIVTGASAITGVTTFKPSKNDVLDALLEIGVLAPATGNTINTVTTLSAAAAKGATQLTVVDPSKVTANVWFKIGTGDTAEYHQVLATNAANPVNLKSALLRAHAIGEAVVAYVEVPFGIPAADGATFGIKGSGEAIRSGARRLALGWKQGLAEASFNFAVADLSLTNIAEALGIDTVANAAAIASGRLPLTSTTIGAVDLDAVYVKAITKGGKTAYFNGWGCTQDISSFAFTIAQKGIGTTPFSFIPAAGVHFQQS